MTAHQGIVEVVTRNKADFYSIKLPDAWYGTGSKTDPGINKGDMVSFEWEANGNFKNVKKGTLTKLEGAPQAGNSQPKAAWVPDADRQKSIIYQSSRKDAIAICEVAQAAGVLALPQKKGDGFDALLALVDDLTVQLAVKATTADISGSTVAADDGANFDG